MSENNAVPQLAFSAPVPEMEPEQAPVESIQQTEATAKPEEPAARLDDSQLTEAEKKAIDDFIARLDQQNNDHSKQHVKNKDIQIQRFIHRRNDRFQRRPRMKSACQKPRRHDAEKQGQVYILQDKSQHDGDDRRKQ